MLTIAHTPRRLKLNNARIDCVQHLLGSAQPLVCKIKQFCPYCKSTLTRIRRTPTDRLISLFTGIKRYQCENDFCGWEGTMHDTAD